MTSRAEAMAGNNPMEQIAIRVLHPIPPVAGVDLSFTNSSLWMLIALAVVAVFLYAGTARPTPVPGRMQAAVDTIYGLDCSLMAENVIRKEPCLERGCHNVYK